LPTAHDEVRRKGDHTLMFWDPKEWEE